MVVVWLRLLGWSASEWIGTTLFCWMGNLIKSQSASSKLQSHLASIISISYNHVTLFLIIKTETPMK